MNTWVRRSVAHGQSIPTTTKYKICLSYHLAKICSHLCVSYIRANPTRTTSNLRASRMKSKKYHNVLCGTDISLVKVNRLCLDEFGSTNLSQILHKNEEFSFRKNLTPFCNPSIIGKTRRHCKMMTIISPLFQHTSSLTSSFVTLALGGILTFNSFARPIKRPHGPIHTWRPTLLAKDYYI